MFEMVFNRKWEAAHRFVEGENKGTLCTQPHGHTWEVTVTLKPKSGVELNKTTNTLVLFQNVKKKWHEFVDTKLDHGFFFNHHDPLLLFMLKENPQGRHIVVPGDPTTELLSVLFKSKLSAFLKADNLPLDCEKVHVFETRTNSILFTGDPSQVLKMKTSECWWNRPDMSTNDLERWSDGYPI